MKEVIAKADLRQNTGKGAARKARARGEVPAIIYGKGKGATPISLDEREFNKAVQAGLGTGRLVKLVIAGDGKGSIERTAVVKEIQRDFISREIIHVDFQEVSLTEAVTATIPVVLVGEDRRPNDGGVLEHLLWEIQLHALPADMPDRVEVDVSGLGIGDSIKVADLKLPEGVRALAHGDETVVTVAAPTKAAKEDKPAAEATEAGAAGGATDGKKEE